MKHQPIKITHCQSRYRRMAASILLSLVGGAAILLMILAEMKFFGT
jgi:hypothetical protein